MPELTWKPVRVTTVGAIMSTKVFVVGPHNVLAALIRLMRRPSMSSPLFFGERILAI
jgi:hypothetical protein